ncbi:MAG: archaemetzincin family Zn-dependent metalloprotease [Candidatus Aminicenantaceae bacterium]
MEDMIYLVPVGDIEESILEALDNHLQKTFNCMVKIRKGMKLSQEAYNPSRNQYFSSHILKKLSQFINPDRKEKVLGITDVDLYVEGLNFVFGEAELGGHFAIISLARLSQSFYGLKEDRSLFLDRTMKEAVHELGHVYGISHCANPECVMHFSNSLMDTDRKKTSFCIRCQELLGKSSMRY